jgi:hypothetical protein
MYRLSGFDPFRSSMRLTKKKAPCGVLSEATGRSGQKWPVMLDRPISANAIGLAPACGSMARRSRSRFGPRFLPLMASLIPPTAFGTLPLGSSSTPSLFSFLPPVTSPAPGCLRALGIIAQHAGSDACAHRPVRSQTKGPTEWWSLGLTLLVLRQRTQFRLTPAIPEQIVEIVRSTLLYW